jgi:hypothetical protein
MLEHERNEIYRFSERALRLAQFAGEHRPDGAPFDELSKLITETVANVDDTRQRQMKLRGQSWNWLRRLLAKQPSTTQ